jgi:hypothetical protein
MEWPLIGTRKDFALRATKLGNNEKEAVAQAGKIPNAVAKKLPRYPMASATLFGRLAVSTEFSGPRVGGTLLMEVLCRSVALSKQEASSYFGR